MPRQRHSANVELPRDLVERLPVRERSVDG
jgi:hypothetical protein